MANKVDKHKKIALRDGLDVYLKQISIAPILSREEEKKLADAWTERRDREAGQKLVVSNLRFVVKIAKEYTKYGFKLPELIQEGNMGLLHALDKFDSKKGYRLITYSVWWIRAYIQAYILRSWSIVRTGTTRVQRKIFSSLQKARQKIAAFSSEPATRKQLAAELDVSKEDFDIAMDRIEARDMSMDQPLSSDEPDKSFGDTFADQVPGPEERLIAEDMRLRVRQKLDDIYDDLQPRERFLLDKRILADVPITLEQAGKEFGVTRERVRQLEERLKGKLQASFKQEAASF